MTPAWATVVSLIGQGEIIHQITSCISDSVSEDIYWEVLTRVEERTPWYLDIRRQVRQASDVPE